MNNYTATIQVRNSTDQVYSAITEEMSDWWTPMSAQFLNLGDQAKTDFGGESYWILEAITLEKPDLIELRCCEAHHIHDGLSENIRQEWLNTVLKFDIKQKGEGTEITLIHNGLVPDLECYDVCKAGWDYYFSGSLKAYLDQRSEEKS